VLPKVAKNFFRRGRRIIQPGTPDKKLHRFRLRAKRFRYTLELFKPCYGPTLSEHITAVKRIQDQLGTMHDCAATLDLIAASDLADLGGAQQLREYLEHRSHRERTNFFEYWQSTFGSDDAEKRWMDYLERFAGRVAKSQLHNAVATATRMLA
jgi:CHAD domain-containing protein